MEVISVAEPVTWPTYVGLGIAAVAAIASAVGAVAAWRSSSRSADAARDASRALATVMFPRVMHHVWHQVADETDKTTPTNRWHLVVWNASGWDAVDAEAEVRLRDGRTFSGKRSRLQPASTGSTAPTPEDDRLVVEMLDMPSDTQAGYGLVVATVVRWSDVQHIATWEAQRDWTNGYAAPFQDSIRQIGGPSLTTN